MVSVLDKTYDGIGSRDTETGVNLCNLDSKAVVEQSKLKSTIRPQDVQVATDKASFTRAMGHYPPSTSNRRSVFFGMSDPEPILKSIHTLSRRDGLESLDNLHSLPDTATT